MDFARRRLREDERREVQGVYRRNVRAVYAFFCYSVDGDTAEDLTASTFERVVRSWGRFDSSRASAESWVLAIARNILRDHYRRQSHRVAPSLDEHPALVAHLAATDDPLERWIAADAFSSWLGELRPRERELLALRYGADLSTEEIGRCLGLTEANVHQITSRALRRLRDMMPAHGSEVSGTAAPDAELVRAGMRGARRRRAPRRSVGDAPCARP
jgi:RNA polymerase sigma factor (sigma-70 family)